MALKSKSRVIRKFVRDCQDSQDNAAYVVAGKELASSLMATSDLGRIQDNQDGSRTTPPTAQPGRPTLPSWADVEHLRWGPEFDDPIWGKAKGLLKAMAFSGFVPTVEGNRLAVTETRGPLTDDDRTEIAQHEADLIPLLRAL